MSVLADAMRLLNDESAVFAFLPGVNYLYYFVQNSNPTRAITIVTVGALFISAVLYNTLTEIDFNNSTDSEAETSEDANNHSSDDDTVGLRSVSTIVVFIVLWGVVFIDSLAKLYTLFSSSTLWPELLTAISFVFVFLFVSDLLLMIFIPVYGDEDTL